VDALRGGGRRAGLGPRAGATTPRAAWGRFVPGLKGVLSTRGSAARRVMLFPCPPSASLVVLPACLALRF
jgi:hypothetical protein